MKQCVLFLLIVLYSGWLYANHWTPVSGAYQNTATITGVVVIDDVEQRTNTLEVGAFCGDECRGSAQLRYLSAIDRYEVFLTIYGEDGNQITFKLYDHEALQELDLNTPDPVAFVTDDIIGDPMDPHVFDFTSHGSQPQPTGVVIELTPGWNWISYLIDTETTVEEALVNLNPSNGDMIKSQSAYSTYSSGRWQGNLTTMSPGRGYIYLRNDEATTFSYPETQSKLPASDVNISATYLEITIGDIANIHQNETLSQIPSTTNVSNATLSYVFTSPQGNTVSLNRWELQNYVFDVTGLWSYYVVYNNQYGSFITTSKQFQVLP